jgi:hypothetical protein
MPISSISAVLRIQKPCLFYRSVIYNQINDDADASLAGFIDQLRKIISSLL